MPDSTQAHLYRVVSHDEKPARPAIEFEAPSVSRAIDMMQTMCGLREVELFEDDRSIGRLKLGGKAGFWIVSPREEAPN